MPEIMLSVETFTRLQGHAEPLVDTIDTVINRALDALESRKTKSGDEVRGEVPLFDPAAPPSLSFTTVKSVVVAGRRHPPAETYWNSILEAVVKEAAKLGKTPAEINDLLIVNSIVGVKEDGGYKVVAEAGVSIQGQDSNGAWRAAFHIADKLNIPIVVSFVWQDTTKAAHPGAAGRFVVG